MSPSYVTSRSDARTIAMLRRKLAAAESCIAYYKNGMVDICEFVEDTNIGDENDVVVSNNFVITKCEEMLTVSVNNVHQQNDNIIDLVSADDMSDLDSADDMPDLDSADDMPDLDSADDEEYDGEETEETEDEETEETEDEETDVEEYDDNEYDDNEYDDNEETDEEDEEDEEMPDLIDDFDEINNIIFSIIQQNGDIVNPINEQNNSVLI